MEIVKNLLVKNKAGEVGVITGIGSIYFTVTFPHKEMKYGYEAFGMRYLVPVKESPKKVEVAFEDEEDATSVPEAYEDAELVIGDGEVITVKMPVRVEEPDQPETLEEDPSDRSDEHSVVLLRKLCTKVLNNCSYESHCASLSQFSSLYMERSIGYRSLGPIVDEATGLTCPNLETYWGLSKVFSAHDDGGKPSKEYFAYRERFLKQKKHTNKELKYPWETFGLKGRVRRPCYYAYYDKKTKKWTTLTEIEARKKILIPLYVKLASETPVYRELAGALHDGEKIALKGMDIFNYYSEKAKKSYYNHCRYVHENHSEFDVPSLKEIKAVNSFKDFVNLPSPLGAASILKAMLDGELTYEDGEIKDPHHILSISKKKWK